MTIPYHYTQRSCWGVYWFHSVHLSFCPFVSLACCVCSVTPTVLDGFFPYYALMIISMRRCDAYNGIWPWCISSRWFSHDFAIKLIKYAPSCHVHSTAHTVLEQSFPYLAHMITSMRVCLMHNKLWPPPVSARSLRHEFVTKLLKYSISCHIPCTTCTVLVGFFPCFSLMIFSMRGCVRHWLLTLTCIFKVI